MGNVTVVAPEDFSNPSAKRRWAELIRLIYEVDPLACPRCGRCPGGVSQRRRTARASGREAGGRRRKTAVAQPAALECV